jgi:NAD(P)H-dependent FMN reductase
VANWFIDQVATRDDFDVDVLDLLELRLPHRLLREDDDAVQAYRRRLDVAEAFVVVTPEYNHAYPASLKQAIDLAHVEWRAKPVAFVSYGGISGGLRAVEQLRLVFAELHAPTIRDGVSFHNPWAMFEEAGDELVAAEVAAKTLLDQLAWWGRGLRRARQAQPYAA